ncbi:hypothetical protein ACA910_011592 [Epithemia clementina (nom. ined.)]
MKLAIATTFLIAFHQSASAFVPQATQGRSSTFVVNSNLDVEEKFGVVDEKQVDVVQELADSTKMPENKQTKAPEMSSSLPFMERPALLDGSMPGDVGFDPLGFVKSKDDLMNYREAEIKHARLAMLAAAGWPLSELFDKQIAGALGITPVLDASDRAPSVLNGGLGKISPIYWIVCLGLAAAIDVYGINQAKQNTPGYFPGNLGFDPLGFYPKTKEEQFEMQLKEIKNGRLAMIAIVAFAGQEFVRKIGVVDETPLFFKPLGTVIHDYANSGYIIPDNL